MDSQGMSVTEILPVMIRFGAVGISGMLVDFSVTWLLKERLVLNKYTANSFGFSVAVVNNFILNYCFTFPGTANHISIYFSKFLLFALIGLALNNLFIYLFTRKLELRFYFSKALAIICVFLWNFLSNNYLNFQS